MKWSKRTEGLWKAFEDAVNSRDPKQFSIYHQYKLSKEQDNLNKNNNQNTEELTF